MPVGPVQRGDSLRKQTDLHCHCHVQTHAAKPQSEETGLLGEQARVCIHCRRCHLQFLSSHPVWFAVHVQEGSEKLQAPGTVSWLLVLCCGTVLSWLLPFPDTGSALGMLGIAGADLKLIYCFLVVLGDAEHIIFSLIKLTISR